jgi:hypothetical protein
MNQTKKQLRHSVSQFLPHHLNIPKSLGMVAALGQYPAIRLDVLREHSTVVLVSVDAAGDSLPPPVIQPQTSWVPM